MKRLSLFFCFLIFSFNLFAWENFRVSISPERGFLSGQIREHVFDTDGGESFSLSRLDWDFDSLFFCGVKAGFDIFNHLELNADGRIGYTGRCGQMQDYDWNGKDKTKNTHYSWHENYLKNYAAVSAQVGWKFNFGESCAITPFFSVRREEFYFAGYNGYSQYASENHVSYWNEDLPKKAMSGNVISYRQNRLFENVGLESSFFVTDALSFSFSTAFGFYSIIVGQDFHNLRKYEFRDIIYEKGLCETLFNLGLSYKINKHNEVNINMEIQDVPVLTGDTYQKKFGADWTYENVDIYINGGGASSTIFSLSLNYSLKF